MGRWWLVSWALVVACGKKHVEKPAPVETKVEPPPPPAETEADREKKRHELAVAIVPEGSSCLPLAFKEDDAPRLELGSIGTDAIVCAIDTDRSRLLGPIACWKLDLKTGALAYQDAKPLPGRGFDVKLDDRCARGFCLPKDAKLGGDVAHIAWSYDSTKVAVLVGDDVQVFDAVSKEPASIFSIRGDKGVGNDPFAIHFIGKKIYVEGADKGAYSAVWSFDVETGAPDGPLVALGAKSDKPTSTWHGAFAILDNTRVALAERGYEAIDVFELDTGKRARLPRKVGRPTCKPEEVEAFWRDGDKVTDRCKDSLNKLSGHFMGATAIAGGSSFLVLLRNDRLGELAVLDQKTLAEKRALKMPWCAAEPAAPKKTKKTSDPDEGGQ
jgi:hypothetical protein